MASIRRIRTGFTGVAGTPWISNHFFTWVNGTEQDAADAVGAFWTSIAALMDNGIAWSVEDDVAVIEDTTGLITSIESVVGGSGAGGMSDDPLPYQTQGLVHWFTNNFVNGRHVRGKTFVPGLTEVANTSAGVMASGTQGLIQTAAETLISATSGPGPLRIFSRPRVVDGVPVAGSSHVVESANVPTKWALLRSRRD